MENCIKGELMEVQCMTLSHLFTSGVLVMDFYIDQSFCLDVPLSVISKIGAIQFTVFIYISNILELFI